MQVGTDVKCMHTNFSGRACPGFGDIATFKTAKFPFLTMDYSPWSSKNLIDRNRLKKFMQVGIDVTCMHTNFGGCGFFPARALRARAGPKIVLVPPLSIFIYMFVRT